MLSYLGINFNEFKSREEALKKVHRYGPYKPMFYRTNLWIHSHRLVWFTEEITPFVKKSFPHFNPLLAKTIAAIHDDFEIIMGDVQLGSKLIMSSEEKQQLKRQEREAIDKISQCFPKIINGFPYKDLLLRYENLAPDDIEGTIVKLVDKFDAFGEALHELFAGNIIFSSGFAVGIPSPLPTYTQILSNFSRDYPLLDPLVKNNHPLFTAPKLLNAQQITFSGKPHTAEFMSANHPYPQYNFWKEITLKYGKELGMNLLTTKIE